MSVTPLLCIYIQSLSARDDYESQQRNRLVPVDNVADRLQQQEPRKAIRVRF